MNHLLKASYDKLLLGLAVAVLAASCLWSWQQQRKVRRLRPTPVLSRLTGAPYEPTNWSLPETKTAAWLEASAPSRGEGWVYELFTPPVIYYNALTRSFMVTPSRPPNGNPQHSGIGLLAVKPEQFRLQLAGYFGGAGDYLVVFTCPNQPETLFARAGHKFKSLGLTFKGFEVKKVLVEHGDSWPVYDIAALAVLADDRTGGEVVLDSRTRKFTGAPLAVLQLPAGGRPRDVREGDTFSDEYSDYRIEHIQLDPPEVVVARTIPGLPQPETMILHPTANPLPAVAQQAAGQPLAGQPAGAGQLPEKLQPFPSHPTTTLATARD